MDSTAHAFGSEQSVEKPLDITILKNSFVNLVRFAEDNLPKESREELFSGYLGILEEALSSVAEATAVFNSISEAAAAVEEPVDESFLAEQLADAANTGNAVLDLTGIESLPSAVVARCFEVNRELATKGKRLVFENVSHGLREAIDNLQIDRFFEIRYA